MFRIVKLTQKFFNSRHAVLDTIFCKSKSAKKMNSFGPSRTAGPELQNI